MFLGKVIGTVWSTVKWPAVHGHKLMVVRPYHLADLSDRPDREDRATSGPAAAEAGRPSSVDCEAVVCVDLLDAGVGDDVVVAFGHAARVAAQSPPESASDADRSAQGAGAGHAHPLSAQNATVKPLPKALVPVVPIDAAIVAIVDSMAVTRPST